MASRPPHEPSGDRSLGLCVLQGHPGGQGASRPPGEQGSLPAPGRWAPAEHPRPGRVGGGFLCPEKPVPAAGGRRRPWVRAAEPTRSLLPAGPPPRTGTSSPWPSCRRSGLKSPADWPTSFLPPGGRPDAACLCHGAYPPSPTDSPPVCRPAPRPALPLGEPGALPEWRPLGWHSSVIAFLSKAGVAAGVGGSCALCRTR